MAVIFVISCRNISSNEHAGKADNADYTGNDEKTIDWDKVTVNEYIKKIKTEYSDEVNAFYRNRNYTLAWFKNGKIGKNALVLLKELEESTNQGLDPELYDFSRIKTLEQDSSGFKEKEAIQLDVLLSGAFIEYASDLLTGRIDPDSLYFEWESYPKNENLHKYLEKALERNSISRTLDELRPHHRAYYALLDTYNNLTLIKNEWPMPGYFSALKRNDKSKNVPRLKHFLAATNDLDSGDSTYLDNQLFDGKLEKAVMKFQERHGLKPDGNAGKMTLDQMNVPLSYRISQVRVNIDRIRLLPSDLGERFIIVNIPAFSLEYFENRKLKTKMDVVVGKIENYTPVLKDTMSHIVLNPEWNVPASIVTEEILPKIISDKSYLDRNNYVLLKGSYKSSDTINPEKVKWSEITPENFPYNIVQQPGGANPLGKIKFMFPNNQAIYLHDSPAKNLFNYEKRDFSHGCVRVQKPLELATILLDGQLKPDEIEEIIATGETSDITLDKKVLVHFMYQTAWVDEEGSLHLRGDIYDLDKQSISLLESDPS